MIQLKFKLLYPDSIAPKQATDGSAGVDIYARFIEQISPNKIKIWCGLAFEFPKGYALAVLCRSSICNTNYSLTNAVGIIDSDYRGEVSAVFTINKDIESAKTYEVGDAFCQLILFELPKYELAQVNELTPTERGSGGFGSTDKTEGFKGFKDVNGDIIRVKDLVFLVDNTGEIALKYGGVAELFEVRKRLDSSELVLFRLRNSCIFSSLITMQLIGYKFKLIKP